MRKILGLVILSGFIATLVGCGGDPPKPTGTVAPATGKPGAPPAPPPLPPPPKG